MKKLSVLFFCSTMLVAGCRANIVITDQRYAELKLAYSRLAQEEKVSSERAQNFIRSLLAENWPVGSKKSENMTTWATEVAQKSGLDIYGLLSEKVEVADTVKKQAQEVVWMSIKSGLTGVALAVAAAPLTGDLSTAAVLGALSVGMTQGAIWGAASVSTKAIAGPRSSAATTVPAVVTTLTAGVPAAVSMPTSIVEYIPSLNGTVIPGWMLLAGNATFQATIVPSAATAISKSGLPAKAAVQAQGGTLSLYGGAKEVASSLYQRLFGAQ